MRRPLVAGNWKMNGSRAGAQELVRGVLDGVGAVKNAEVAVCPPYIFIPAVAAAVDGSAVMLGGQNLDIHESGAYTGEISGPMLADFGCKYCIVGHSERRALYGESNELVADKFMAAQQFGLTPILCIGETLEQREAGATESIIDAQLDAVLSKAPAGTLSSSVLAYEPVWAIGTGKTATPEQAQDVHEFIRQKLSKIDPRGAADVRILYGGSVKPENAQGLFEKPDIDGGLIGGASLDAGDFLAICRAA